MKKKLARALALFVALCFVIMPAAQASAANNVTKSFKDTKKVTKLVNQLNDWSGYQYIYVLKSNEKRTVTLSEYNMLNIAALNYYEPNLGDKISATEKGIVTRTNLLFGKNPGIDSLNTYENDKASEQMNKNNEYICKLSNGGLATVYGDWGMYYPKLKLLKIVKVNDKQYQVKVKTYFINDETKKKDDYGVTVFTIKKSANAANGYIITGIKLHRTR